MGNLGQIIGLLPAAYWPFPTLVALGKAVVVALLLLKMVKRLPTMQENPGSIPELGGSSGEGNGNPLQYPWLENPMDGGAW